ncbi:MAG: SOS response-associated peptidase family protein [Pseudomonadota bacterium]
MCNIYSQTVPRQLLLPLFDVSDNRATAFEPHGAIYPGNNGIVIRCAADGTRECVEMSWGFVLNLANRAPKRVTNFRDDKLDSRFWSASLRARRCLIPVSSFAEPKGRQPAIWHWFALNEKRTPFAFAGIWQRYKGPLKAEGTTVEIDVYSFMTTMPNALVAAIHPSRMPVMLVGRDTQDQWLNGTPDEALQVVQTYPAESMRIVQSGMERYDSGGDLP